MVIDYRVAGPVVTSGELRFANRHANRIGEALTERAGCSFYAGRAPGVGVSRRLTIPLTKLLDVVERKLVTGQM
jgi:hypothetical protein